MPDSNDALNLVQEILKSNPNQKKLMEELSKPNNFTKIFEVSDVDGAVKPKVKDTEIERELQAYAKDSQIDLDKSFELAANQFVRNVDDKTNENQSSHSNEASNMIQALNNVFTEHHDDTKEKTASIQELSAIKKQIEKLRGQDYGLSEDRLKDLDVAEKRVQETIDGKGLATKIVETLKGALGLDKEEQQKAAEITKKLKESAEKVKAAQATKVEFEKSTTVQKSVEIEKAKGPKQQQQTAGKDLGAIVKQAPGAAKEFAQNASGGERAGGSQPASQSAGKAQAQSTGRGK